MGIDSDLTSESYPFVSKKSLFEPIKNARVRFLSMEIILNPSISVINFATLLIFSAYLGFILVPINMLQLPLLRILYHEGREERDTTTTISQTFELLTCIIMAPVYGYLCDKYGRKPIIAYGMVLTCLATALMPYLPGIYPHFILVRLIFVNGYTGMIVVPLLADYIDSRTQGSVAAIMNILGNLGALLSINLVQDNDLSNTIGSKLVRFGYQSFFIGMFILFGLKQGTYHKRGTLENQYDPEDCQPVLQNYSTLEVLDDANDSQAEQEKIEKLNCKTTIEKQEKNAGILSTIKNMNSLPLAIGYMLGFLGTCQGCLLGFALINYSTSSTGNENAASQSYSLANASIMIGVLTSAFYGAFADQLSKFKLGLITITFSTIAVALMIEAYDPYSTPAYVSMIFFGLAGSGYSILNGQLISRHADVEHRGAIFATNTIICTLGTGAINVIGLYLSKFSPLVPFYMYLGFSVTGLIVMLILYSSRYEIIQRL